MSASKRFTICALMTTFLAAFLSSSGFQFLGNQYVYFRFSKDAGLPQRMNHTFFFPHVNPFFHLSFYSNQSDDAQFQVQSKTSELLALLSFVGLGSGLVSVHFMGTISDHYGRGVAIALILLGMGLNEIITTFVILLELPVLALVVSWLISGFFGGGVIALFAQFCICLVDLTQHTLSTSDNTSSLERQRLVYMCIIDAVSVFSNALGNGLMGFMIKHLGFDLPALIFLGIFCIPVCLIHVVPDTRLFWTRPPSAIRVPVDQAVQRPHPISSTSIVNGLIDTIVNRDWISSTEERKRTTTWLSSSLQAWLISIENTAFWRCAISLYLISA